MSCSHDRVAIKRRRWVEIIDGELSPETAEGRCLDCGAVREMERRATGDLHEQEEVVMRDRSKGLQPDSEEG